MLDKSGNKIDGKPFAWDIIEVKEGRLHVIKNNKSYNVEVIKADYKEKSFILSVNGTKYNLTVKDKFDELLKSLGMDAVGSGKINDVKAPMPGMVLDIRVSEGEVIKKGDAILVLEAMKMENILKSPTDGTIKKIQAKQHEIKELEKQLDNPPKFMSIPMSMYRKIREKEIQSLQQQLKL